jgi:hypothetical protein
MGLEYRLNLSFLVLEVTPPAGCYGLQMPPDNSTAERSITIRIRSACICIPIMQQNPDGLVKVIAYRK